MAILTVSREFGSGGREIGKAVADALGYEYVDKERIYQDIKAAGYRWEAWGKDLDERSPTLWERYDWSYRGFAALLQSTILGYALRNRVVIMGRGGNFVLKGIPHCLSIRVMAPVEFRCARIAERDQVDVETARWLMDRTDRERSGFTYAMFHKKWDDSGEYDRVFDCGVRSRVEIVEEVVQLLKARDALDTEAARKLLSLRATAARVKAGLATDPRFFIPILEVEVKGEGLLLTGVIHNRKEHQRVEKAARKLAGEVPLRSDLHYRA
jgi:cytidylate kinase